jgi:hypothetical protein
MAGLMGAFHHFLPTVPGLQVFLEKTTLLIANGSIPDNWRDTGRNDSGYRR